MELFDPWVVLRETCSVLVASDAVHDVCDRVDGLISYYEGGMNLIRECRFPFFRSMC